MLKLFREFRKYNIIYYFRLINYLYLIIKG